MSNQFKYNNLEPITKTHQRTDKREYGTTKHVIKMKDMQRIEERIEFNSEGKLTEIYIQFSDETSRHPSKNNPEETITYRDEITFYYETPQNWMSRGEARERVGWSTGWQDDLEGKKKEAEIRAKALKYFEKRKAQILKEQEA